jgi:hypothetical protein
VTRHLPHPPRFRRLRTTASRIPSGGPTALASILAVAVIGPSLLLGTGVLRAAPPYPRDEHAEATAVAPSVFLAYAPSAAPGHARTVRATRTRATTGDGGGTPTATPGRPDPTRKPTPEPTATPTPARGCTGERSGEGRTGADGDDGRHDCESGRHRHRGCGDGERGRRGDDERSDGTSRAGSDRARCGGDGHERDDD